MLSSEQPVQLPEDEQINKKIEDEDDDDFGEFSEVQVAPKPQTPTLPVVPLFIIRNFNQFIIFRIR